MQVITKIRGYIAKGVPYLAWASFILALTGGTILPGTPFGKAVIRSIDSFAWDWLPAVVFCAGIVGVILDLRRDLIPDRVAVYFAGIAPTVAGAVSGKLADKVTDFGDWVAGWSTGWLVEWSGIVKPAHIAILCMVLAQVIAQRVMRDRKGGAHGHGGVL